MRQAIDRVEHEHIPALLELAVARFASLKYHVRYPVLFQVVA